MKRFRKVLLLFLTIAGFLLVGAAANADPVLSLTLDSSYQSGVAGDTLTFFATVTNIDLTETVYLNSDSRSVDPRFVLDDSSFYNNFPLYLNPGDTCSGEMFSVLIPYGTPLGLYTGSIYILGGSDENEQNVIASAELGVNVIVTDGAVPEPSSLVLLTGLASFAVTMRRQRIE